MNEFLLLLACHFIGDFPFQSEWLASNKGKSWECMIYHCLIYTFTFVLFAKISLIAALIIFVSHLIIDPLKARYKIIKHIWLDQLLHVSVLLIICLLNLN